MVEGKPGRGPFCAVAIIACALAAGCSREEPEPGPTEQPLPEAAAPHLDLPVSVTAEKPGEESFLEVGLDAERRVIAGGQRMNWKVLTDWLSDHAEAERELDVETTPSSRAVLLSADRDALWRDVQWTLQACAEPRVRIYRIHLAVLDGSGEPAVLPLFLPKDLSRQEAEATIEVRLGWWEEEDATRIKLLDSWIGSGDPGFAELDRRIGLIVAQNSELPGQLDASAAVRLHEAVRALDILRRHGVPRIKFTGARPPR